MPIRPENRGRYPKDWKLRSRFVRFVRARNKCEWCGAANGQPHPLTGSTVVLTTAHVYDDRPEASSLLNLAALCQKCHNGHDAKARQQRLRERRGLRASTDSRERQTMTLWNRAVEQHPEWLDYPLSSAQRRRLAMFRAEQAI